MGNKHVKLSDQIRAAVDNSGLTRREASRRIGITESVMSKFMAGKCWLGQSNIDALAELLDLHVTAGRKPEVPPLAKPGPKPKAKKDR